jgi:hypothetical protein
VVSVVRQLESRNCAYLVSAARTGNQIQRTDAGLVQTETASNGPSRENPRPCRSVRSVSDYRWQCSEEGVPAEFSGFPGCVGDAVHVVRRGQYRGCRLLSPAARGTDGLLRDSAARNGLIVAALVAGPPRTRGGAA